MVSEKEIKEAFAALMAARQALYEGSEKELAAKAALKTLVGQLICVTRVGDRTDVRRRT